ncbi:MAG: dihydrodipicolinate reductase [Anaerolineae bacterium]|nr:dihydrodipicolinate reductase [Anaerolineae bacterium]
MSGTIRAVQFGLGPIGNAVARHVVEREGITLVGGVDIDPTKVGRDVGKVIGLAKPLGFAVSHTLADALAQSPADVVLHTTSSYFDLFKPQIINILQAGLNVVSTAEEMSFPWLAHAEAAAEIDAAAKRAGKTVLATGVNPGFLMDALPLALTGICQQVNHIDVRRVINASTRRGPFQAKIGAGMTVQDFEAKMAAGRMGHVGLPESIGMVFDTLGKSLVRYESNVEPVVAERLTKTDYFEVQPGRVIGLKQTARADAPGGEFMALTFIAALDAGDEQDTLIITGRPNLKVTLQGTNGDLATVAIVVNAARRVCEAAPGLLTMRDLPLITWW